MKEITINYHNAVIMYLSDIDFGRGHYAVVFCYQKILTELARSIFLDKQISLRIDR